jgi:hypothetical protein
MKRHDVFALLHEMPGDIDPDDLIDRLYWRQKIAMAEAAAEAGDVFSHEAVVRHEAGCTSLGRAVVCVGSGRARRMIASRGRNR